MRKPILAFVLILLFHVPAPDAQARSHLSKDPRVENARALLKQGRHIEALRILRPLAKGHRDRTGVLFLIGLSSIEAARRLPASKEKEKTALLDEAIAALRAILINRPGLVRVRLELARAFFFKREDALSREHFERVLAGKPPPLVAKNVRRFLTAMRARRRWRTYFGFSIAPDTNISAVSNSEIIYIHDLPFRRNAFQGESSGVGLILWGGGEYQHPLGKRLRLRLGADASRREYEGNEFDQMFVSLHAGPRWRAAANTELSLLGSARRRWTGGEIQDSVVAHNDSALGARFEINHRFTRKLTAWGRASWHERAYRKRKHLDGPVLALSLSGAWLATSTIRTHATVGYGRERPESQPWRNKSGWARLGASIALPLGFTVGGSGEMRWTQYEGGWFPFTTDGSSREDRTRILQASVFNRVFTVFGFSPQLVVVNEARESNAQLYDYKRTRAELRFVRQF